MNKWYIEKGDQGDVVLSTRVRLARNLDEFPFPAKLDPKGRNAVNKIVKDALTADGADTFKCIDMKELTQTQAVSFAERHLISPEFTQSREGRTLIITEDESVSIMLCEEDHIRLQVMKSGLSLHEAYDIANKIDNILDGKLRYAFDERIGYLTQCPTNLGTAMRASVMLHLPALTKTGKLSGLAATVSKLGLTIRGAYGEGTAARGAIYQLSNQITLGITEQAALDNLNAITLQIVAQERAAQRELLNNPAEEDQVYRAMGILNSARMMDADEFMGLISLVRMGAARGLFNVTIERINELIVNMQPATLMEMSGRNLEAAQRDAERAKILREILVS
ncbi:MAG: protein arginine kinase [Oscillospiraceae bacterium]|nr:protein arginine kinase [Oscillospiraceae bacterium]